MGPNAGRGAHAAPAWVHVGLWSGAAMAAPGAAVQWWEGRPDPWVWVPAIWTVCAAAGATGVGGRPRLPALIAAVCATTAVAALVCLAAA